MKLYENGLLIEQSDITAYPGRIGHSLYAIKLLLDHPFMATKTAMEIFDTHQFRHADDFQDKGEAIVSLMRDTMAMGSKVITETIAIRLCENDNMVAFVNRNGGYSMKNEGVGPAILTGNLNVDKQLFEMTFKLMNELYFKPKVKHLIGIHVNDNFIECNFGQHYETLETYANDNDINLTDAFIRENVKFINTYMNT